MYSFEFDENKSNSNKVKHGIDFKEAIHLWEDENRIVVPAKLVDEPRYLMVAKNKNSYWSTIFTIRKKKIRIISVRRSRKNEIEIYES